MRLLGGIRRALADLSAKALPDDAETILGNVRLALNELMLREKRDFFDGHYREGAALVAEGAALAAARDIAVADGGSALAAPDAIAALGVADLDDGRVAIGARLCPLVEALAVAEARDLAIKAWLGGVVDWENALYQYRLTQAPDDADGAAPEQADGFTEERIAAYLAARFPERAPVRILSLRKLFGGFSKTTILLDVAYADGEEAIVLRADPAEGLLFLDGAKVQNEYHILKIAHAAGHAVAEPLWLEQDAEQLGKRFLVSRKAAGQNIGSRVDINQQFSDALLGDFIARLVRIHQTPIDLTDPHVQQSHLAKWAAHPTLKDLVAAQVRQWKDGARMFRLPPSPLVTRALEWMAHNVPDYDEPPALLHGDYGLHNILIEGDQIRCILDWESSSLGDPADDLAWLLDGLRAQIDPARITGLYEEISGRRIPPERLHFFEVFNSMRFGVVCARALGLFQANPLVDVAACDLGLRFPFYGTGRLNRCIADAEAVRPAA